MATLINVCGSIYSGTTMVELMLGNAPDAFSCGEVMAWFRPWRSHHFELKCSCGEYPCPIWERIKGVRENVFHKKVIQEFDKEFVIDSSKNLCWLIDNNIWARNNQLRVVNLLVWKKPLSIAYSHWKRKGDIISWERVYKTYYQRFFDTNMKFVSLCYNDLMTDPGEGLKQLCKVVGMPYFEGKELFWKGNHHYLFGSEGVRQEIQKGDSRIRKTEKFQSEFLKQKDRILYRIKNDPMIEMIYDRLAKGSFCSESPFNSKLRKALNSQIKKPYWYYTDWLRRCFRRRFPIPYDAEYI